jgi:hypothetical protein
MRDVSGIDALTSFYIYAVAVQLDMTKITNSRNPREGNQVYLMSDHSGQQIVIPTTIWWWQKLGRE